ncbi:MAG: hypothetical protein M3R39_03845, partial [Actinomycetota bacterium]|nr:hypothetical protein [Actinomycetota bacterium]
ANPSLQPREVAALLKATATGRGAWTPELGYGVIDVAAAVARAQALVVSPSRVARRRMVPTVRASRALRTRLRLGR